MTDHHANRGTSNSGKNGNSVSRRARKRWLIHTYRADVDVLVIPRSYPTMVPPLSPEDRRRVDLLSEHLNALLSDPDVRDQVTYRHEFADPLTGPNVWSVPRGLGEGATRCYRCGKLLWYATLEVDRIHPGWKKTTKWPRGGTYVRENIRPACGGPRGCNIVTGNEDRWGNHKPFRMLPELLALIAGDPVTDTDDGDRL